MEKYATISDCTQYRHSLKRIWDKRLPMVMFVMLNPSTADASKDDPTIRKCISYARAWGYGGLLVGNIFDYRTAYPARLLNAPKPFSHWNEGHIKTMADECDKIIMAWGNPKVVDKITDLFPDYDPLTGLEDKMHYLELCIDGTTPKHPLYLKGNLTPIKLF